MVKLYITTFLIIFFTTHYVSLGSVVLYIVFVGVMTVLCFSGALGALSTIQIVELLAISLFMAIMAIARHWSNIKRLIKGEESKTYLSKKNRK